MKALPRISRCEITPSTPYGYGKRAAGTFDRTRRIQVSSTTFKQENVTPEPDFGLLHLRGTRPWILRIKEKLFDQHHGLNDKAILQNLLFLVQQRLQNHRKEYDNQMQTIAHVGRVLGDHLKRLWAPDSSGRHHQVHATKTEILRSSDVTRRAFKDQICAS